MADVQKEKGHTQIAHGILEALAFISLTIYEYKVALLIIRKTYGWNKKMDRIALSQFEKETRIKRPHVVRTLNLLISKNIVKKNVDKKGISYGFQKNYDEWVLPKEVMSVTSTGNKVLPLQAHTKESKETKQKKQAQNLKSLETIKTKKQIKSI